MNTLSALMLIVATIVIYTLILLAFDRIRGAVFATDEQDAQFSQADTEIDLIESTYFHRGYAYHLRQGWYGEVYRANDKTLHNFGPYDGPYEARRGVEDEIDLLLERSKP